MAKDIHKILNKYWSYTSFRHPQEDIINSVLSGFDTLSILATGSGKSLCFQVPALCMEGTCLVVSPLIALMKDQIDDLRARAIKAVAIHSGMDKRSIDILLDNVVYGNEKFLYVSPERLKTELFLQRLKKMDISFIAVDEAHCISEWGHDFRPAYRNIAELREILPGKKIIALTATATKKVQEDIISNLRLKDHKSFIQSPVRKNLIYKPIYTENYRHVLMKLISASDGSSILYVNKRYHTKELEKFLMARNIRSKAFHAGLKPKEKESIIDDWNNDKLNTIIATSAFGMGMDKSNVRNVIHFNIPNSLEAYVQEAGRAGRDGGQAKAILLWNLEDVKQLRESIDKYYPPKEAIRTFYQKLSIYLSIAAGKQNDEWLDLDLNEFCENSKLGKFFCLNALKILKDSEIISLSDSFEHPSRLLLNDDNVINYLRSGRADINSEKILNTILRSYEGVRWASKPIDELHIAKKCNLNLEDLISYLNRLEQMDILEYNKGFVGHKINFNTYRFDHHDLKIKAEAYEHKKSRMHEKIDMMIRYIKTKDCRQKYISEYFGIESETECGICDNCEIPLSKEQINDIIQRMLEEKTAISAELLKYNESNTELILQSIMSNEEELRLNVVNDKLVIND